MTESKNIKDAVVEWVELWEKFKGFKDDLIDVSYGSCGMDIQLKPAGFAKVFTEWKTEANGRYWAHSNTINGVRVHCLNFNPDGPMPREVSTAIAPVVEE
jgi:hypothetical protein